MSEIHSCVNLICSFAVADLFLVLGVMEWHELSRSGEPEQRVSRLIEMINWFDKYVGA